MNLYVSPQHIAIFLFSPLRRPESRQKQCRPYLLGPYLLGHKPLKD